MIQLWLLNLADRQESPLDSTPVSLLSLLSTQCSIYLHYSDYDHLLPPGNPQVTWQLSLASMLSAQGTYIIEATILVCLQVEGNWYIFVGNCHFISLPYFSTFLEPLRASQLTQSSQRTCPLLLLNTVFLIYVLFCSMEDMPFFLEHGDLRLLSVICYWPVVGP